MRGRGRYCASLGLAPAYFLEHPTGRLLNKIHEIVGASGKGDCLVGGTAILFFATGGVNGRGQAQFRLHLTQVGHLVLALFLERFSKVITN